MSLQQSISSLVVLIILVAITRQALQVKQPDGLSQYRINAAPLPMEGPCTHPVTIVSAYYPLNESKHSSDKYDKWMADFFPYVTAPIVLYSPPGEALDYIRSLRGDLPMTVKVNKVQNASTYHPDDIAYTTSAQTLLDSRAVGDTCHHAPSHRVPNSAT